MQKKLIKNQLNNSLTLDMYRRQFVSLAESVFVYSGLPPYIDDSYMNKQLLCKGSIAFFVDEVLGLLALPYTPLGNLDIYSRPIQICVYGKNGYRRNLNQGEFVIMYDNQGKYPLYSDVIQYAQRMALYTRTCDINITQQKTPRMWKTSSDKEKSIKDMLDKVDGYEDAIVTYDSIDWDDTSIVLSPAPFVADKINIERERIYNEFLRLIGVSNVSYQKKERNIRDEIAMMQGGTIASRYNRYIPRVKALKEIKDLFSVDIEIKYYDGIPTSIDDIEGDEINVL